MRVIPVLDLQDGVAVHAVRGERERYRPVRSVLVATADPLAVAGAFRSRLGLDELYAADLDAIRFARPQRGVVAGLAAASRLWLDGGVSDGARARELLAAGVHRVVIGSETLADGRAIAALPAPGLVFSLDLRDGAVLARDPGLAASPPLEVLAALAAAGWREVIVLDLARVGARAGPDTGLLAAARRRFPELSLIAGGGVRRPADLEELARIGIAGALIATALHRGEITAEDLRALA